MFHNNKENVQETNKTYTVKKLPLSEDQPFRLNEVNKFQDDSLEVKHEPISFTTNALDESVHRVPNLKRELSSFMVFSPPKKLAVEATTSKRCNVPLAKSTPKGPSLKTLSSMNKKNAPIITLTLPIPISVPHTLNYYITDPTCSKEQFLLDWVNNLLGYNQNVINDSNWRKSRKIATDFFKSHSEMIEMTDKIVDLVDRNKISIRKDRNLHTDQTLQKAIGEILLNYNRMWLTLGLEVVIGLRQEQQIEIKKSSLTKFFIDNLYRKPKTRTSLYLASYEIDVKKYTLKKLLILIFFLDRLKLANIVQWDYCLFHGRSEIKQSRQILFSIARELFKGVGDASKELNQMIGYVLHYEQDYLDELNYQAEDFSCFRDGLILMRIAEKLRLLSAIKKTFSWKTLLRFPAISRLQKVHNIQMVLRIFELDRSIDCNAICDGNSNEINKLLQHMRHCHNSLRFPRSVCVIERWWKSKPVQKALIKRKQSALIIQRAWKSYKAQKDFKQLKRTVLLLQKSFRNKRIIRELRTGFLNLKKAVVFTQRKWRLKIKARKQRLRFLELKNAAKLIQQRYRASRKMKHERSRFIQLRFAVIQMQIQFRSIQLAKPIRERFLKLKYFTVKIQMKYRANRDRRQFIRLRQSTIFVQQRFKAMLKMRIDRMYFLKLRVTSIAIQRKFRANLLMKKERDQFKIKKRNVIKSQAIIRGFLIRKRISNLRKAVFIVENRYCANLQMKRDLETFKKIKWSVSRIQKAFRSWQVMVKERANYLKIRNAAIVIQSAYRSYLVRKYVVSLRRAVTLVENRFKAKLCMRAQLSTYQRLRSATILTQRKYRANRLAALQKRRYQSVRKSAILIQAYFRGRCERRHFEQLKKSAIHIQRHYRAKILMQKQSEYYRKLRFYTIWFQRKFRTKLESRKQLNVYMQIKKSACLIQAFFRGYTIRKTLQRYLKTVVFVQRKRKAVLEMRKCRNHFLQLKMSTIFVQRCFRNKLLMVRDRYEFLQKVYAVITIQKWYRGFSVRKRFQSRINEIKTLAGSCVQAQQSKLKYDFDCLENYDFFSKYNRTLAASEKMSTMLVYVTRLTPQRLLSDQYIINVGFSILANVNRSHAHYDFTLNWSEIVLNLVRFKRNDSHVFKVDNYMDTLLMTLNSSLSHKDYRIFLTTSTIIWVCLKLSKSLLLPPLQPQPLLPSSSSTSLLSSCSNENCVSDNRDHYKRMEKIEETLRRKCKIQEKLKRNANSETNTKNVTLKSFKIPSLKHDFSVPSKNKPYIFENCLHAVLVILSLLK